MDLLIAHTPERIIPGNLIYEMSMNDRIVRGINERSSKMTADLYRRFVKGNIHITDSVTAEVVKPMENTFREINIAYANELAMIVEKLKFNLWEAIELANSHPRVNILKPGPGVGVHRIPVDPWLIVEKAPVESKLIQTARKVNDEVSDRIINHIEILVESKKDPLISLLGLSFKGNTEDYRDSPSLEILDKMSKRGYRVKAFDPYIKQSINGKVESITEALRGSDLMVLLTDHSVFQDMEPETVSKLLRTKTIFDTRNLLSHLKWELHSVKYVKIGSPELGGDYGFQTV
ncbi:nucleotide sugar dehydrogenase [Peribacillus sp. SCS-26]|uniref:nucleotide sugar dehydrogenase n=1 Tax=Paraperibacillus marinus TaxID=3115295 RepID=UPI0039063B7A